MCTFSNDEVEFLKKWGNENAAKVWLATLKKSHYPVENLKDIQKLKEYVKNVFVQKKFYKEPSEDSGSENGSSDEEENKKPPPKKIDPIIEVYFC